MGRSILLITANIRNAGSGKMINSIVKNIITFVITVFFVFALGCPGSLATDTRVWQAVGPLGFSPTIANDISMVINDQGVPYVAHIDHSCNEARVQKFNGMYWTEVGTGFSMSDGPASELSLAIDNNVIYAAYRDGINGNKASVKKYNPITLGWDIVGNAGFSSGEITDNYQDQSDLSLYVTNGSPYVAYSDGANGSRLTVQRFNGTTWETVGNAGFSAGKATCIDLVIDGTTPYVAYSDEANAQGASVMKFNGANWEPVGIANLSAGSVMFLSLAIDNHIPYVAYFDASYSGKTTVMKYTGAAWEAVGTKEFTQSVAECLAMTTYQGTPYVSFKDVDGKISVMKYNGAVWEYLGNAGISDGGIAKTFIYIHDGTPYIAYTDDTLDFRLCVKKFADPDTTAPQFIAGYPQIINVTASEFTIMVKTDEPCCIYYKKVADGSPPPSLAEIKLGGNFNVESANTEISKRIWDLPSNTAYDVYVITQDALGHVTDPIKLDVATKIDECFIATAAYGSKYQPVVKLLRDFRDDFLMKTGGGKTFVDYYYKNSPPIAAYIATHAGLKALTRTILVPIAGIVYLIYHPCMAVVILLFTGILWISRKRNHSLV